MLRILKIMKMLVATILPTGALMLLEDMWLRRVPELEFFYSPSTYLGMERAFGLVIVFTFISTSITLVILGARVSRERRAARDAALKEANDMPICCWPFFYDHNLEDR